MLRAKDPCAKGIDGPDKTFIAWMVVFLRERGECVRRELAGLLAEMLEHSDDAPYHRQYEDLIRRCQKKRDLERTPIGEIELD